jgi:hypothetical protein
MQRYVDANSYNKAKSETKKMGLGDIVEVTAVDKDYAYVPTNVSQSAKGGRANVSKASDMNIKRFGLEE